MAYRQAGGGTRIFGRSMVRRCAAAEFFAISTLRVREASQQKNSARLVNVLPQRTAQQKRNTCAPTTSLRR